MNEEIRKKKEAVVKEISEKLSGSDLSVLVNYRGLTVEQFSELRGNLHKDGSKVKVYKNTLTKRAADELKLTCPSGFFKEPIALVTSESDAVSTAKVIVDFAKDVELFQIKGGFLDNAAIDESTLKSLAKLPSKEVLLGKLIGGLQAPLYGLVNIISSPTRNLAYALNALKEQKNGGN